MRMPGEPSRKPGRVIGGVLLAMAFLLLSMINLRATSASGHPCAVGDVLGFLALISVSFWSWSFLVLPSVTVSTGAVVVRNPFREWLLPLPEVRWREDTWPYPVAEWRGRRIPLVAFEISRIPVARGSDLMQPYVGRRRTPQSIPTVAELPSGADSKRTLGASWRCSVVQGLLLLVAVAGALNMCAAPW